MYTIRLSGRDSIDRSDKILRGEIFCPRVGTAKCVIEYLILALKYFNLNLVS